MRSLAGRTAAAAVVALALFAAAPLGAQLPVPAVPEHWLSDHTQSLPEARAAALDRRLEEFERATSIQFLVVLLPSLQGASLEDWTIRAATAWRAGRKDLDNGLVLFLFTEDRKVRFEVGYGLEGAIPDAIAGQIIRNAIVPRLRANDTAGAIEAAIGAVEAATRGEYKGDGSAGGGSKPRASPWSILFVIVAIVVWIWLARHGIVILPGGRGGVTFGGGGWRSGGGGFSGGGGSFGGGGASGSW